MKAASSPPKRALTLEILSEWLAGRLQVPYLHIDPLRLTLPPWAR